MATDQISKIIKNNSSMKRLGQSSKIANKILVLGQTPPPFHGQAMMIEKMLDGTYTSAELWHVRMAFAKGIEDLGVMRLGKLFHTLAIILKVIHIRLFQNTKVLYYPPAGPNYLPMCRDIAILLSVRWMFKKTIFHFHAAGVSDVYQTLPRCMRILYKLAYFRPDVAIQLSNFNPDDSHFLQAKSKYIIPNGIEDSYFAMGCPRKPSNTVCNVLYVGMIRESKGFLVLIDAIKILREAGVVVMVNVVGQFVSEKFRQEVFRVVDSNELGDFFVFWGILDGQAKHEQYLNADIFCFPTFYASESFGLVVVEAMQFCVPIIATRWRGVQSLLKDGEEGFLVPVQDSTAIAEKMITLVEDPELRLNMGIKARQRFLQEYTIETFCQRMNDCFDQMQNVM